MVGNIVVRLIVKTIVPTKLVEALAVIEPLAVLSLNTDSVVDVELFKVALVLKIVAVFQTLLSKLNAKESKLPNWPSCSNVKGPDTSDILC